MYTVHNLHCIYFSNLSIIYHVKAVYSSNIYCKLCILHLKAVYFSNLYCKFCKLQHVVEGRETLSEGMDLYCSGVDSLTNFHHLLHSLQQAVKNNVRINIISIIPYKAWWKFTCNLINQLAGS